MISRTKVVFALAAVTVLACAAVGVLAYRTGAEHGRAEVQAKWDAERAAHARAVIAAIEERDRATADMAARVEALTKEHRREINRIAADRDRLLASLRDRPEARAGAGGVPESAAAGVGCTGEGLSRGDAAFLAGFAADAARTQAAFQQCVAQYNEVREQMYSAKHRSQTRPSP